MSAIDVLMGQLKQLGASPVDADAEGDPWTKELELYTCDGGTFVVGWHVRAGRRVGFDVYVPGTLELLASPSCVWGPDIHPGANGPTGVPALDALVGSKLEVHVDRDGHLTRLKNLGRDVVDAGCPDCGVALLSADTHVVFGHDGHERHVCGECMLERYDRSGHAVSAGR